MYEKGRKCGEVNLLLIVIIISIMLVLILYLSLSSNGWLAAYSQLASPLHSVCAI
jgi:hypothetical protein